MIIMSRIPQEELQEKGILFCIKDDPKLRELIKAAEKNINQIQAVKAYLCTLVPDITANEMEALLRIMSQRISKWFDSKSNRL